MTTNVPEGKRLLLVMRHSPYGSSLARASLDVALAAAAFDQPVTLLFTGDGVLQLLPHQDSEQQGVKNIGRLMASLPLYDIEHVYVDSEAAASYRLDIENAPVTALALDSASIAKLISEHDHVLGF